MPREREGLGVVVVARGGEMIHDAFKRDSWAGGVCGSESRSSSTLESRGALDIRGRIKGFLTMRDEGRASGRETEGSDEGRVFGLGLGLGLGRASDREAEGSEE